LLNLFGKGLVAVPGVVSEDLSFWSIDEEYRLEAKYTPDFHHVL
jgi:hypothetical protein